MSYLKSFVVIVDGDRKNFFRLWLTDYIIIQNFIDFVWGWQLALAGVLVLLNFFTNYVVT